MEANNSQVVFGDINLSEQPIRGNYNPGAGGWPTIRYFNQRTGCASQTPARVTVGPRRTLRELLPPLGGRYEGAPYTKKTDGAMCDELGKESYMQAYVEE